MSNYNGYTVEHNLKRKSNNMDSGKEENLPQTMNRTKQYGGSGPSSAAKEAKEMREKSKNNPVKVWTQEEIDELNSKLLKLQA